MNTITNYNGSFTHSDDDIHVEKNQNGVDVYVFEPYNPLNKIISLNEIQTILKNYGVDIKITNYNLYKRAFVHRSNLSTCLVIRFGL